MGNDDPADQRGFKYLTFHQSIYAIENDIKKELYNPDIQNKKYSPYGLINHDICKKYKFLLNEKFDENEAKKYKFNYKDLVKKNISKKFNINGKNFGFDFPSNFIFVNQDFFDIIRDYDTEMKYQNKFSVFFKTIIGGGCLIMKDAKDNINNEPFRYITLYNEIQEDKGNEIDFFLYIKI